MVASICALILLLRVASAVRTPIVNRTFITNTTPTLSPSYYCSLIDWVTATSDAEDRNMIRLCSTNNRSVSFAKGAGFVPGTLDRSIPGDQQNGRTYEDGRIESTGALVVLGVFKQSLVSPKDVLFVRISTLSQYPMIAPAFLLLSPNQPPDLSVIYGLSSSALLVYDEEAVKNRQLAIVQLDAGSAYKDVSFSSANFDFSINGTTPSGPLSLYVVGVMMDPGTGFTNGQFAVLYLTTYYEGSQTNAIIIGVIFIFVAACCTPCILIYCFACFAGVFCGQKRYAAIVDNVKNGLKNGRIAGGGGNGGRSAPAADEKGEKPVGWCTRIYRCFDKSISLAIIGAAIASAIMTIAQLVAMVFNIVLLQKGLALANQLVPSLEELAATLVQDWKFDITPLIRAFNTINQLFDLMRVSVASSCLSARNIISAAICVWTFWFIAMIVFTDAFVRVKNLITRARGPIADALGQFVITALTLGMQTVLQQANMLVGRLISGDVNQYGSKGCTHLDDEAMPITRPGTAALIVILWIMLTLAFMFPRDREVFNSVRNAHPLKRALYYLFGSVWMLVQTTLGVWSEWAINYVNLIPRATAGVSMFGIELGESLAETMDAVTRMSGMFFIMFWPPLIVISKISDATAEAPIWVGNAKVKSELDPTWQRVILWTTNLIVFILEVKAAASGSASAVVGATVIIVLRDMLLKLLLAIIKIKKRHDKKLQQEQEDKKRKRNDTEQNQNNNNGGNYELATINPEDKGEQGKEKVEVKQEMEIKQGHEGRQESEEKREDKGENYIHVLEEGEERKEENGAVVVANDIQQGDENQNERQEEGVDKSDKNNNSGNNNYADAPIPDV